MATNVTSAQLDVNIALSVVITCVTIPSNFLLILIFCRFKNLRDLNNTAITMLSVTDFLRGCIVMTMKIHNQMTRTTELKYFMCHLTAVMCAFSFVFSPLVLALISFVRYCRIVPHSCRCWQLTDKIFYIISFSLFLVASLFSILPYLGVGDYAYSESHGVCFADWRDVNRVFRTIFYILVIGIAFPVLTVSYTMLYLALRKHNKTFVSRHYAAGDQSKQTNCSFSNIDNVSTQETSVDAHISKSSTRENSDHVVPKTKKFLSIINFPKQTFGSRSMSSTEEDKESQHLEVDNEINRSESKVAVIFKTDTPSTATSPRLLRKRNTIGRVHTATSSFVKNISKQEYQVTKLLILIFIAYVVCWFPAAMVNVISLTHMHSIPEIWYYIIVSMVELKSALDPVIYGLGNRKYRNAIKIMAKQLKTVISAKLHSNSIYNR